MDVPDDHVPVFRTSVDVLVAANDEEDALRAFDALAGGEVSLEGHRIFVEDAYAVEGEAIDPDSYEGEGPPLHPGEATIAVQAWSSGEAESIFRSLNGSSTLDGEGREVSFDLADGAVEEGTMPAPPPETSPAQIAISRPAHRFAWENGGSLYVWAEPFGQGFMSLAVSTRQPLRLDFELGHELELDGRTIAVHVQEGLPTDKVAVRLQRFPRTRLVVAGAHAA